MWKCVLSWGGEIADWHSRPAGGTAALACEAPPFGPQDSSLMDSCHVTPHRHRTRPRSSSCQGPGPSRTGRLAPGPTRSPDRRPGTRGGPPAAAARLGRGPARQEGCPAGRGCPPGGLPTPAAFSPGHRRPVSTGLRGHSGTRGRSWGPQSAGPSRA